MMSQQQFYETVQKEQEYLETLIEGKKMNYQQMSEINVNDHVETKNGLNYLSWAWAWDAFKKAYPEATYKVVKSDCGLPYFESNAGVMVYTEVTANNMTHEMWLPVMDGANKAMKREAYTYKTKFTEKTCDAFDMFDVNKTIMRCLVKNLAMFGLAIYIYAGEDLPTIEVDTEPMINGMKQAKNLEDLKTSFGVAWKMVGKDVKLQNEIKSAYDKLKDQLEGK
jgi:hypothetical protein